MSDSERKINRRKKGVRIPSLPNKIVVIKNADKDSGNWMESWSKPKKRCIGHIPHPFRLLALGGVGRGKTNSVKNLFLKHQSSAKKFKKLYIITCDENSGEWLDCEPDLITDQMVDLDMFNDKDKTMVIIDDYEFEKCKKEDLRKLSTLMRFISSHRNVSVIVSYQSFFNAPSIARKCANCFLLYKPNSKQECTTIENRCGLDKGTLKYLFKNKCNGIYDSVMVDKTIGTPYPLRKNIYEPIQLEDSDSE